jgi:protein SCO1/2
VAGRCRSHQNALTVQPADTRASRVATRITLLAICVTAAVAAWTTTFGFRAWTTEEIRRLRVQAHAPHLSTLELRSSDGGALVPWGGPDHKHRVWLLTFMYTRCPTLCTTLGIEFERLQRELGADSRDDRIRLLSISFDPLRDDTRALRGYATQHHSDPTRWIVAAPKLASDLHRLERETGTVVIDDGLGGYTHNAAIHVVVTDGRLVRIFDFNQPEAALACARNLPDCDMHC